jgi:hypothetical protein
LKAVEIEDDEIESLEIQLAAVFPRMKAAACFMEKRQLFNFHCQQTLESLYLHSQSFLYTL